MEQELYEHGFHLDFLPKSLHENSSKDFVENHLKGAMKESFLSGFSDSQHTTGPKSPISNSGKLDKEVISSFGGIFDDEIKISGTLVDDGIKIVDQEQSNLPSEQALSSSLAKLSLEGEAEINNANSQLDATSILDYLKEFLPPPPQSPNTETCTNTTSIQLNGFDQLNVETNGHDNVNFMKLDGQVEMQKVVSCHPFAYNINPSQVFPSVHTPVLGMQSQELIESLNPWLKAEEQYAMLHKKYMHWNDLRSQLSEARNLIQANENLTNGIRGWNIGQSYLNNLVSCQYENCSETSFQSGNIFCRYHAQGFCGRGESSPFIHSQGKVFPINLTNSGSALHPGVFDVIRDFGKMGEQSFTEKILMRKNGLNSVKGFNFDSIRERELFKNPGFDERAMSNSHSYHNACIFGTRSSHMDNRKCWVPDAEDGRHNILRLQPRKYNSIDEVIGIMYFLAKDQSGCRFLQRKMAEGNVEDIHKIFLEIVGHVVELMTHPFGNYLVQKLLEVCGEDQRTQLVYAITVKAGDLIQIAYNMHGTRSVQKLIETIQSPEQFLMVVSSLKPGIVDLIRDPNGYHVAECCLQYLMPGYIKFLFEPVTAHCVELATDCHGCRVLQKCLGRSDGEQRCHLISAIVANAFMLSQHPFGNYVVQYVFDLRVSWATTEVLNQLKGYYRFLSMQKYSSNVVEKCLKYAGEEHLVCIVKELMNNPQFDQMMLDPYGNYVIQTALKHTKGDLHAALLDAVKVLMPTLQTNPYGKKILSSSGFKK